MKIGLGIICLIIALIFYESEIREAVPWQWIVEMESTNFPYSTIRFLFSVCVCTLTILLRALVQDSLEATCLDSRYSY